MRRWLTVMTVAITVAVVLAFVAPLWWLVGRFASERALTEARQQALALAPAIATGEVAEVEFSLDVVDRRGLTVVMPDGTLVGDPVPPDADLMRVRSDAESFETRTSAGVIVHRPVVVDDDVGHPPLELVALLGADEEVVDVGGQLLAVDGGLDVRLVLALAHEGVGAVGGQRQDLLELHASNDSSRPGRG